MVWSDIPTPPEQCVLIVICYDSRVYRVTGQDRTVGHNQMLDCAVVADHILLMVHALSLGVGWLTSTEKIAQSFKEHHGLPDHIEPVLHTATGWLDMGSTKSQRMSLSEMLIKKESL